MEGRDCGTPNAAMHRLYICCTMQLHKNGAIFERTVVFAIRGNAEFFSCVMWKSGKGYLLQNVLHLIFRKLPIDNFLHSAFCKIPAPSVNSQQNKLDHHMHKLNAANGFIYVCKGRLFPINHVKSHDDKLIP